MRRVGTIPYSIMIGYQTIHCIVYNDNDNDDEEIKQKLIRINHSRSASINVNQHQSAEKDRKGVF